MLNDTSRGSVRIPEMRPGIMWTCTVRAATIGSIVNEREITKLTSGGLERDQNFLKSESRKRKKI
jgi:hypothetical protein